MGYQDIGIRKSEVVAKTRFLYPFNRRIIMSFKMCTLSYVPLPLFSLMLQPLCIKFSNFWYYLILPPVYVPFPHSIFGTLPLSLPAYIFLLFVSMLLFPYQKHPFPFSTVSQPNYFPLLLLVIYPPPLPPRIPSKT